MTAANFSELVFTAPEQRSRLLLDVLAALISRDAPLRILDLGCGTGRELIDIAAAFPHARCVGIDLSAQSVSEARRASANLAAESRLSFQEYDYLSFATEPFDVIVADSVLHTIQAPTHTLAGKLGRDLNPDGLLVASMPYDCFYNRLLWSGRRVLRAARGARLERAAVTIGRLIHPSWSAQLIRERIPYLFMKPARCDNASLRGAFRTAGRLVVQQWYELPHASPAQPKHRLLVFRRLS